MIKKCKVVSITEYLMVLFFYCLFRLIFVADVAKIYMRSANPTQKNQKRQAIFFPTRCDFMHLRECLPFAIFSDGLRHFYGGVNFIYCRHIHAYVF